MEKQRKYHEIWGNELNQLNFFKKLTLIMAAIVILLLITLKTTLKKPPIVIRVNEVGKAEVLKDIKSLQKLTVPEINNFTQYFLQYFLAHNYYTYDEDFTRAFNMMSPDCRQKLNEYLQANNIINDIKTNQLKTKMQISEIKVEKDSPDYIILKVKGSRDAKSYTTPDYSKETIFEDEITLAKVNRTAEAPWGLLVDSWQESIFKGK